MSVKRLGGVLFIAVVLAAFIRMFFFETIRVTTSAMSENQTEGNRLIVEKWSLGARLPLFLGMPFAPDTLLGKQTYFTTTTNAHRLIGFGTIRRNDLIAFNFPIPDHKPLDLHPILLSRCVGLPGEYIRLRGVRLFINDEEVKRATDVSICYRYPMKYQKNMAAELLANQINRNTYQEKDSGFVYLTRYEYYNIARRHNKNTIPLKPCTSSFDEKTAVIPYEGFRIKLNDRSFKTWGKLINQYEGVSLIRTGKNRFRKNGKEAEFFVFKQNYYWLLNDHQGYLNDSRIFGAIPESYILGKAWLVLFSPKSKRILQKI